MVCTTGCTHAAMHACLSKSPPLLTVVISPTVTNEHGEPAFPIGGHLDALWPEERFTIFSGSLSDDH
uniref:Uncharacterized protein n=1 Tax=Onchocerca volvulus TaxID=6282 RepID=A0A8R1TXI0_ONCVO